MLVPVYDIINCGPRSRYVANGKLVHNCDKINLQNLPSRGENAGKLKSCIEAPRGYVLIDADSSNIEARGVAWLAEQEDLLKDFAAGVDVYCKMATSIYGKEITKANELERFVGKTVILGCFAADTLVVTDSGPKRIVDVGLTDRVWDGESWVTHKGLLYQGMKNTLKIHGVAATADHAILTEHGWVEWQTALKNPSLFQSALRSGNLPLLGGIVTIKNSADTPDGTQSVGVVVDGKGGYSERTYKKVDRLDAINARKIKARLQEKCIGVMRTLLQTTKLEAVSLTELRTALADARGLPMLNGKTTGAEVSLFTNRGLTTEKSFYDIWSLLKGGMTYLKNWIGSITIKDTNPVTSDSLLGQRTCLTEEPFKHLSKKLPVYDLSYCGPKNRFTILTHRGPIIVHNCGYGTGADKLKLTLSIAKPPVIVDEIEALRIINTYRQTYKNIPALWDIGNQTLYAMQGDKEMWFGRVGAVWVDGKRGFKLPNGLYIQYPDLQNTAQGYVYKDVNGMVKIYGAKCVENVVQALAGIIVKSQLLRISKKYKVVLTVHDSVATIAREEEKDEAIAYIAECMRWVPEWADGWPLNCEIKVGHNYGEMTKCKI